MLSEPNTFTLNTPSMSSSSPKGEVTKKEKTLDVMKEVHSKKTTSIWQQGRWHAHIAETIRETYLGVWLEDPGCREGNKETGSRIVLACMADEGCGHGWSSLVQMEEPKRVFGKRKE